MRVLSGDKSVKAPSVATVTAGVSTPASPPQSKGIVVTNKVPPSMAKDDQARVLQSGDRVEIHLRAIPQPETLHAVVDETGSLTFPYLGAVSVVDMTCSEAERMVEKRYIDGEIYKRITVIIVPPESEYAVQGEVLRPGQYPISRDLTLMQALARAGRYTEYADSTKVRLIRGRETIEINAKKIESNKENDIVVKPGDVIVVPRTWL